MHYTIFDTPILRTIIKLLSIFCLKITEWQVKGKMPDSPKCVVIAAPHTSNWDLPYTLFVAFAMDIKMFWMGKDAIFKQPFNKLFQWLGGIPIDRSKSHNIVQKSIDQFQQNDNLVLAIPPSGTRQKIMYWKTGFYHIANGANVPIALGFLDYKNKTGGIGYSLHPTGDIEADMETIRKFYKNITGKYPLKSISSTK